jgi:hypothetical protein
MRKTVLKGMLVVGFTISMLPGLMAAEDQPTAGDKTVGQWVADLSAKDRAIRERAAKALGEIKPQGREAICALAACLEDKEGAVSINALDALSAIGVKAIPALIDVLLRSKDAEARHWAAIALGQIGHEARVAVPYLTTALQDENTYVRQYAAEALGKIGPESRLAVPGLIPLLRAKEEEERSSAALALGEIGPDAAEAVPALGAALKDDYGRVIMSAAWALGRMGSKAKGAVPALTQSLKKKDANPLVRETVAAAYCEIARGPEAVPMLTELLKSESENTRSDAVGAIGEIGPDAKAAVPALIAVLKAKEAAVRRETAWALGRIGPDAKDAVPALVAALGDEDKLVRRRAADALRAVDSAAARKAGAP